MPPPRIERKHREQDASHAKAVCVDLREAEPTLQFGRTAAVVEPTGNRQIERQHGGPSQRDRQRPTEPQPAMLRTDEQSFVRTKPHETRRILEMGIKTARKHTKPSP